MSQKYSFAGLIILSAIIAFALTFNDQPHSTSLAEKITHQGRAMGTTYSVVYFNASEHEADVINQVIDQAIVLVNDQMSTYKSDSNLSVFNQKPAGSCYQFPKETYHVLSMAQEIANITGGAFDVTVGPLVNLWGFGPDYNDEQKPTQAQIEKLKSDRVGYQFLKLEGDNRVCKDKDIYVDLSAIAKGYAVDLVAERLDELSISSYLIEIGGELKAKGLKLNGEQWRVAVEEPDATEARSVHKIVALNDLGIATSGDYRNYYEVEGKRYSHTINPATGNPIEHNLASISVLHDSVAYADAMATALNVVGPEKAYEIAEKNHLAVYMLVKEGQSFKALSTQKFTKAFIE